MCSEEGCFDIGYGELITTRMTEGYHEIEKAFFVRRLAQLLLQILIAKHHVSKEIEFF